MTILELSFLITILTILIASALIYKKQQNVLEQQRNDIYEKNLLIATLDERLKSIDKLEYELTEKQNILEDLQRNFQLLQQEKAVQSSQFEERERHLEEKLKFLSTVQEDLGRHFAQISQGVLEKNNKIFLELANQNLSKYQQQSKEDLENRHKAISDSMLSLKETIAKLEVNNKEMEEKRTAAYSGLFEQVKNLSSVQTKLQSETRNLVTALRAPQQRGRWGEIQLRRVVELAGLIEYCDFEQQVSSEGGEGKLRPDLIVRLPNDRNIVVDSKVALDAYLTAIETEDDTLKVQKLKEHAVQVKRHVLQLSAKSYWQQFTPAPEFVVMFLPGEPIFSAALEQDPSLIEIGAENKVLIATPMTLIALLRAVAYGWRQEKIAENAIKVSSMATDLYNRMGTMAEHFSKVGLNLDRSVKAYNDSVGSMERMVMPQIRKLKDLGMASGNDIPELEPIEKLTRELNNTSVKKNDKKSSTPVLG